MKTTVLLAATKRATGAALLGFCVVGSLGGMGCLAIQALLDPALGWGHQRAAVYWPFYPTSSYSWTLPRPDTPWFVVPAELAVLGAIFWAITAVLNVPHDGLLHFESRQFTPLSKRLVFEGLGGSLLGHSILLALSLLQDASLGGNSSSFSLARIRGIYLNNLEVMPFVIPALVLLTATFTALIGHRRQRKV